MLINHFHVFPEGVIDKANPKAGSIHEVIDILDDYGPETAGVLFAPHTEGASSRDTFMAERIEPNQWLYEAIQDNARLYGFVTVNPKDRYALDILEEYIRLGFKGVKMHNAMFRLNYDDPELDSFYKEVARLDVPMYFHTGPFPNGTARSSMPLTLDRLAFKYPKMKIIIGHLGGYAFFTQTWAMLQAHKNCYAELANTIRPGQFYHVPESDLLNLIHTFGSDRVIYGTDTPWPVGQAKESVAQDIGQIQAWPLSDKEKDDILGETMRRVLSL